MGIEELESDSKHDTEGNFCEYSQSRDMQQNKATRRKPQEAEKCTDFFGPRLPQRKRQNESWVVGSLVGRNVSS